MGTDTDEMQRRDGESAQEYLERLGAIGCGSMYQDSSLASRIADANANIPVEEPARADPLALAWEQATPERRRAFWLGLQLPTLFSPPSKPG
jgi:hypothetical protein